MDSLINPKHVANVSSSEYSVRCVEQKLLSSFLD